MFQSNKQTRKIIFSGLFDLSFIDVNVVDLYSFVCLEFFKIKSKGGNIYCKFLRLLFKGNDDTGLIVFLSAINDKFNTE